VRALERALGDAVDDRLADPLPGVGDQQVIDSPIGEGEGGQLDNIDQLAGFDDFPVIGRIKGIAASLLREGQGGVAVQGN
jgi:hypothetical protein